MDGQSAGQGANPVINTKHHVMRQAASLFSQRGVSGVSVKELAEECQLAAGSLFHYFKNKNDIAVESVKYISRYVERELFRPLYALDESQDIFKAFFDRLSDFLQNNELSGALLALHLSLDHEDTPLKKAITEYTQEWHTQLIKLLQKRFRVETAKSLARDAFIQIHGAKHRQILTGDTATTLDVLINLNRKWHGPGQVG